MKKDGYDKAAQFYDFFDEKDSIDFFSSYALRLGEALDIGSGTGRMAIPIAERGIEIYCVEPSLNMIEVFNEKLEEKPEIARRIKIANASSIDFKLEKKFKYIFMSGVFDHLLDKEERLLTLKNIKEHLSDDGIVVFDVFLGLMKESPLTLADSKRRGLQEYRREIATTIIEEGILEVILVYSLYENNVLLQKVEQVSYAGIITKNELIEIVKDSGFEITNTFSDYDSTPFKEGDKTLILELRKRKD